LFSSGIESTDRERVGHSFVLTLLCFSGGWKNNNRKKRERALCCEIYLNVVNDEIKKAMPYA